MTASGLFHPNYNSGQFLFSFGDPVTVPIDPWARTVLITNLPDNYGAIWFYISDSPPTEGSPSDSNPHVMSGESLLVEKPLGVSSITLCTKTTFSYIHVMTDSGRS